MSSLMSYVTEWAKSQYGLVIHAHQSKRITNALDQLKLLMQLNDAIIIASLNAKDSKISAAIVNAITVQESYFFRDPSLFDFLHTIYFPNLIEEKIKSNDRVLRIWSAGCARGEEIYSIAILLKEMLPNLKEWRIELLGTDIDEAALQSAILGVYTKSAMRVATEQQKQRYFIQKEGLFYLNNVIKALVSFKPHNIADVHYPDTVFDLIICRNVFIYLTPDVIEQALSKFESRLNIKGYLFLGPSDFISFTKHNLSMQCRNGVTYFTQKDSVEKPIIEEKPMQSSKVIPYVQAQRYKADQLSDIKMALEKDPLLALRMIDAYQEKPNALFYQYKAQALMRINDTQTAEEVCDLALRLSPLNYTCLILKALVGLEKGHQTKARNLLNKALTGKRDGLEALYYLAQMDLSENNLVQAKRNLYDCLELATSKPPSTRVIGFESEDISEIIHSLKEDLQRIGGNLT